ERVVDYLPNVHSLNPTRFGFDGLKEIAGSTLTYLFCEKLKPRMQSLSWVPVVGMSGDTLLNPRHYNSFNKEVLDFAVREGILTRKEGVSLLGGMAEKSIEESIMRSILPFIRKVGGNKKNAISLLKQGGIYPGKNVLDLNADDVHRLTELLGEDVQGDVILINHLNGILKHPFEFNFLLGILGNAEPARALELFDKKNTPSNDRKIYHDYIDKLILNLSRLAGKSTMEGTHYKFHEIKNITINQLVSDIASFTSVNHLIPDDKMLVISRVGQDGDVKLSFRCSPTFLKLGKIGAGSAIEILSDKFGGRGGGHDLAGGWLMSLSQYSKFIKNIDDLDEILN
ncbi:MAG: DHH family phosphoesterase, partial [Promethearchaeota archaeon]